MRKKSSGVSSATPEDTTYYVRDYCDHLPDVVRPLITERDQHRTDDPLTLPSSCWTGTSSGSFTRKRKTSGGPSWSPPTAPPIPSATSIFSVQDRRQEVESPTKHLNRLREKNHSSSKAIAQAYNKQFAACTAQHDRALRMLMRGPPLCGPLVLLTELFNLLVAGVDITAIFKNSVIIPIMKARKPRDEGHSYRSISLLFPAVKILEQLHLLSIE